MNLNEAIEHASKKSKKKKQEKKETKEINVAKALKLLKNIAAQNQLDFIYNEETFASLWKTCQNFCRKEKLDVVPFFTSILKNWLYVVSYLQILFDLSSELKIDNVFNFDFFYKKLKHIYHLYLTSDGLKIKHIDPIDAWNDTSRFKTLPFAPKLKNNVFPFLKNEALHDIYSKVTQKQAFMFFKPKVPVSLWRSFDDMSEIPLITKIPDKFGIEDGWPIFPWTLNDGWYNIKENNAFIRTLKYLGLDVKSFKNGAPADMVSYALMVLNVLNTHPRLLLAVDSSEAENAIDQLLGVIFALTTRNQTAKIEPYSILQLLRGYDRFKDEATAPDDILKAIVSSKLTIIPSFNEGYIESSKYEWFVYLLRSKCRANQKCIIIYNCESLNKLSPSIVFRNLSRQYYEPVLQILKRDFFLIGLPQLKDFA